MTLDVSPAAMIARIDQTIAAIIENGAASYGVNGRQMTMLDIPKLREERAMWVLERDRSTRRMFAGVTFRPPR